jgi:hypothetical protein
MSKIIQRRIVGGVLISVTWSTILLTTIVLTYVLTR